MSKLTQDVEYIKAYLDDLLKYDVVDVLRLVNLVQLESLGRKMSTKTMTRGIV
jgi:hypothetical protein